MYAREVGMVLRAVGGRKSLHVIFHNSLNCHLCDVRVLDSRLLKVPFEFLHDSWRAGVVKTESQCRHGLTEVGAPAGIGRV